MKYIKSFNFFEAVIVPNVSDVTNPFISNYQEAVEYGIQNGFDVVEYDEFYESL